MPELDWLWLALMGFGTGVYGVLVGAGGGFILGPLLLIFFKELEPQIVVGTVLALVAVNSISGSLAFRRMGTVDRRSAYLFAAAAIPGSVIGPFALNIVAPGIFKILFGIMLISLALRMATQRRETEITQVKELEATPNTAQTRSRTMVKSRTLVSGKGQVYRYQFNEVFATAINFVLGFISSFFGTGGGFLRTPILVYAFGFPVQVAVATSIFTLSFYTTAGAATHAALGHVQWFPTFVLTGIGLVLGGQIGARLTGKIRGAWILRLLLVVVLGLGIKLLLEGIQG